MEFPKWAVPLRDNPEWKKSFNDWVDQCVLIYAQRALLGAKDMETLLGLRFAVGELEALKAMINFDEKELERERSKQYVTP